VGSGWRTSELAIGLLTPGGRLSSNSLENAGMHGCEGSHHPATRPALTGNPFCGKINSYGKIKLNEKIDYSEERIPVLPHQGDPGIGEHPSLFRFFLHPNP